MTSGQIFGAVVLGVGIVGFLADTIINEPRRDAARRQQEERWKSKMTQPEPWRDRSQGTSRR